MSGKHQRRNRRKRVATCIYCGFVGPGLSKEHVVAHALGGTEELLYASCHSCRDVTSNFEADVARHAYGAYRSRHLFPTRRPNERQSDFEVRYVFPDDSFIDERLPIEQYPSVLLALRLPPPGIMTGQSPTSARPAIEVDVIGDGEEIRKVQQRHPAAVGWYLTDAWAQNPELMAWPFVRMLAKIAHVWLHKIVRLEVHEPLLNGIILGTDQNISYLVGGIDGTKLSPPNANEVVVPFITADSEMGFVLNLLPGRLPPYVVIAARPRPPAQA